MAQHRVYHDRCLIEAVLTESSVDIADPQTWHRLSAHSKTVVAAELANRSGAPHSYCDWVIRDYFGQKFGRRPITQRPFGTRSRVRSSTR